MSLICFEATALSTKHYFTVFIGPFNASMTEFTYDISPKEYSVQSTVKTNGLFDSIYPFEASYFTTGRITDNDLDTKSYKYSSKSRFNKRSKELVYNEQGEPVYSLSSKNGKTKKREIIPTPDNKDTTDLQTVIAAVSKLYSEMNFCASRMKIFDGKRRFDVVFQDEGLEEIEPNEHSTFSGIAAKCSMYIDKLDTAEDDLLWQLTSDKPVYFWILKDEQTNAPFIARIKINNTPLGTLNAYTTKIEAKK